MSQADRPSLQDRAGALGYRAGWSVVSRLPERVVGPALDRIADRITRGDGKGVRRLAANLAVATGEDDPERLQQLTRAAMRSYLRYWGEAFRLPRWDADAVRAKVDLVDDHRLRDAYATGGGVVAALPHQGNWDLAGAWACAEGMPLTTVAERLRPESLYEQFVDFRQSLGFEVLPMTGGDAPMPTLLTRLRAGAFVCLLADRDLSRHGIEVDLLGRRASLPSGPAVLAQQTGATLLPITSAYDGAQMRLTFHEPVEHRPGRDGVAAMTQDVADAFSTAIRRDPVDWHMLQRVFR
ncbi:phosphatidylinositol mannoside acyltransferase [Solicola sp. PLA-1-18]|uniref:phosphatidylinositol mannoside acyltransferase n=1 Tax=Solicola sp. PLA-1-18 TaxID=3380532 RepID=UPI003B7B94AA